MAKAVGLPQNSYCLFAKVRASLPDSTLALLGDLAQEKTTPRHASRAESPAALRVSGLPDPKLAREAAQRDADPRREFLAQPSIGTPPTRHPGDAGKRELLTGP